MEIYDSHIYIFSCPDVGFNCINDLSEKVKAFKDKISRTSNQIKLCLNLTGLVTNGIDAAKAEQRLNQELEKIAKGKH